MASKSSSFLSFFPLAPDRLRDLQLCGPLSKPLLFELAESCVHFHLTYFLAISSPFIMRTLLAPVC